MPHTAGPVILIIDDAIYVSNRIKELIGEMPDVSAVHSASELVHALSSIQKYSPAVIILEMHFGGNVGREIFQFIKSEYPLVKIIIASNKATADYRQRSLDSGAHGFIDKTTEFEKIPAMIRSFA